MKQKAIFHEPKVFGSTVVNTKGQVVIPAHARKELGIGSGDTLLAFGLLHGQALLLLKSNAIEQIISLMSEQLTSFEKLVKEHRAPKRQTVKERVD